MSPRYFSLVLLAAAAASVFGSIGPAAADTCSDLLVSFHRPNTTITTAQTVPAGSFVAPNGQTLTNLPQFCRVVGFAAPTTDSHIGFEVWIPETSWNGKYLQAGCGGFCGSIGFSPLAEGIRRGYATAATDDGHQSPLASWAVGHPEKVIDFGFRAVKETADTAKAIVQAFEGMGPKRSYFSGCSDGGREGLMEAQRFPQDFDGIIAGSPANFWTHLLAGSLWDELALTETTTSELTQADLNVLTEGALAQCVGRDGGLSTDNFLNDPRVCHFNPETLLCNGANGGSCLTQEKVEAVKKIFSGPPSIFPGYGPGGEASIPANWPLWITGNGNPSNSIQAIFSNAFFADMVFPNSGWTPTTFSVQKDTSAADERVGKILNSVDPDLQPFKARGGKLIQYVGWSDSAISPFNGFNYYNSVIEAIGGGLDKTQEFYRLFMVPGMSHCAGGPGPNAFGNNAFGTNNGPNPSNPSDDLLSALDRWVEQGIAPDQIIATKYVNNTPPTVAFQRPLCVFPKVSKFSGGDPTLASSWMCVAEHGDGDGGRN